MIGVAIIGYGYWGPNLARNFAATDGARVACIAETCEGKRDRARHDHPTAHVVSSDEEAIGWHETDAVIIATPATTHHAIAKAALRAGKHVLVEKPLAATVAQSDDLLEEARRAGRLLMVDHTFPYTDAVRALKRMIDAGDLGRLYYYDSVRVNLGLFQHDVNVIWDLAVHDLAILEYLLDRQPCAVSATGMSHVPGQPENIAFVTLFYEDDLIAHLHVNWLSPVKVRRTLVGGSRRMAVYNDLEVDEKLRVYDSGVTIETDPDNIHAMRVGYRTGDLSVPKLGGTEALSRLARHFVECAAGAAMPRTGAESGRNVVRVLEAADASMDMRGRTVEIDRPVTDGAHPGPLVAEWSTSPPADPRAER